MMNERRSKNTRGSSSKLSLLKGRNFRLLWVGQGVSLLGDQFYLIALPWLVLQLTGDAFAMGMVLALAGIPRALFMLVGGALTDRFSPRLVMLVSNIVRMILVALLMLLVLTELTKLWMLYIFALAFGLMDAFFFPSSSAIVPLLVDKEQLQTANALIHGTAQLSQFAGPVLAGLMIALLAGESVQAAGASEIIPETQGIGIAFGFDALTFLISAITLWMINISKPQEETSKVSNVLASTLEGVMVAWNNVTLRTLFLLFPAMTLLVNGPIIVGIPVLADSRLPEGAAAFGIIMSAFGGGALLGTALAGMLPKPAPQRLGTLLMVLLSTLGIELALLGMTSFTFIAALVVLAMGIANGYFVIQFVTWLQSRTPRALLGRMMSLMMFSTVGLHPVSTSLTGALIKLNITALFVAAGTLMTILSLLAVLNPAVRAMGVETVDESTSGAIV